MAKDDTQLVPVRAPASAIAVKLQPIEGKPQGWLHDPATGKHYYAKFTTIDEVGMTVNAARLEFPQDGVLHIVPVLTADARYVPGALAHVELRPPRNCFLITEAAPEGPKLTELTEGGTSAASWLNHPITSREYETFLNDVLHMNKQGVFNHDLMSNTNVVRDRAGKLHIHAYDFEPHTFGVTAELYKGYYTDFAAMCAQGYRLIEAGTLEPQARDMLKAIKEKGRLPRKEADAQERKLKLAIPDVSHGDVRDIVQDHTFRLPSLAPLRLQVIPREKDRPAALKLTYAVPGREQGTYDLCNVTQDFPQINAQPWHLRVPAMERGVPADDVTISYKSGRLLFACSARAAEVSALPPPRRAARFEAVREHAIEDGMQLILETGERLKFILMPPADLSQSFVKRLKIIRQPPAQADGTPLSEYTQVYDYKQLEKSIDLTSAQSAAGDAQVEKVTLRLKSGVPTFIRSGLMAAMQALPLPPDTVTVCNEAVVPARVNAALPVISGQKLMLETGEEIKFLLMKAEHGIPARIKIMRQLPPTGGKTAATTQELFDVSELERGPRELVSKVGDKNEKVIFSVSSGRVRYERTSPSVDIISAEGQSAPPGKSR